MRIYRSSAAVTHRAACRMPHAFKKVAQLFPRRIASTRNVALSSSGLMKLRLYRSHSYSDSDSDCHHHITIFATVTVTSLLVSTPPPYHVYLTAL